MKQAEPKVSERQTYSMDEVAALLGVHRITVYELARQNRLPVPVIRIGRRVFVSRKALDDVLSSKHAS